MQGAEDKYVCSNEQLLAEVVTAQAGDRIFLLFFTKASGEGEVISLKGSRQILSDIVMLESEGMVSLRLGNENQISRLFIDANERPNAAGLIFRGDRHRVEDVFVTGMSARWRGELLFRSAEKDHDPSDNIIINHVTIMDSPDSISIGTPDKNPLPSGLAFNSIVAVAKTPQDRVLFVNDAVNAFHFTDSLSLWRIKCSFSQWCKECRSFVDFHGR